MMLVRKDMLWISPITYSSTQRVWSQHECMQYHTMVTHSIMLHNGSNQNDVDTPIAKWWWHSVVSPILRYYWVWSVDFALINLAFIISWYSASNSDSVRIRAVIAFIVLVTTVCVVVRWDYVTFSYVCSFMCALIYILKPWKLTT